MIFIIRLLYLIEGQEKPFNQSERKATSIISKYNGRFLLRLRPKGNSFIQLRMDKPYEIQLMEFDSEQDFQKFNADKDWKMFLHLQEKSMKTAVLIQGKRL